jgi:transcriptional regulator with XRE-family HTH domain
MTGSAAFAIEPGPPAGANVNQASESVGILLRQWRNQRGLSQLHLALSANVSTRHISFVENGRSNPSREMIIHLSDALDIPLRERNRILKAAGFAALYRQTPLDDPALSQVSKLIDLMLESHHPAGAVAVDWAWNVVRANRAMTITTGYFVDLALLAESPPNMMRLLFAPGGLHEHIINWEEVAPVVIGRIRREADYEGHAEATQLLDALQDSPVVAREWLERPGDATAPPLISLHLRKGDVDLRLFSAITTLGTPQDVTLQELRIETFHPADEDSQAALHLLCNGASLG